MLADSFPLVFYKWGLQNGASHAASLWNHRLPQMAGVEVSADVSERPCGVHHITERQAVSEGVGDYVILGKFCSSSNLLTCFWYMQWCRSL